MNKRVTKALREKANELSTIKRPEMKAKVTCIKKPYSVAKNEVPFINKVSLSYAPGTTQQVFNKLKAWYLNLPSDERSIDRIKQLKEIPC